MSLNSAIVLQYLFKLQDAAGMILLITYGVPA